MRSPGVINEIPGDTEKIIDGITYRKDDKVRLRLGQRRSDAIDMLLHNKIATIEVIYTDYDGNIHVAVTVDDDPGQQMKQELGMYLFFNPDEIELIKK